MDSDRLNRIDGKFQAIYAIMRNIGEDLKTELIQIIDCLRMFKNMAWMILNLKSLRNALLKI